MVSSARTTAALTPFNELWEPWAARAGGELAASAGELAGDLVDGLRARLADVGAQAVYELFSRRAPHQTYEGFLGELRCDNGARLAEALPALGPLLDIESRQYVEASVELLAHAAASPWGRPFGVETGLSDRHHRGRSVARLACASGTVLYKPRPLDMEEGFARFVEWLNEQAHGLPDLRAASAFSCGRYGFAPEAPATPCGDQGGARRLGVRFGMLVALADVFGAVDLHAENVVASGEHPLLVDVETLFHPPGPFETEDGLLRTELLPRRLPDGGRRRYVLSGLGAVPSGHIVLPLRAGWRGLNSDAMARRADPVAWPTATVVGSATAAALAWSDFCGEIEAGFERMARFVHHGRSALWADNGPVVGAFAGARGRFVPRATKVYAALIDRARTAAVLASAEGPMQVFARLLPRRPGLAELCAAEREALARGDVPWFASRTTSAVIEGEGRILTGLLAAPGLAWARARALGRTEQDWRVRQAELSAALRSSRPPGPTEAGA